MKVLIASGGTGGHIFPAISVAQEIKNRRPDAQVRFVGATKKSLRGLSFLDDEAVVRLPAIGLPRKLSVDLAAFAFRLVRSLDKSLRTIASFRPDVAIGFGNFGSFAPLLAAKMKGVPIAIHEANAVPGTANHLLSWISDRVLVNFPSAVHRFPHKHADVVGMPVRKEFVQLRDRLGALAKKKLSSTKLTLLVIGGSQGARTLNHEVCNLLPTFDPMSDRVQFIHLTGEKDYPEVRRCYERSSLQAYVAPFHSEMKILFDAADLVLARAGASTIAEILQTGKPAVLVPFPYATAQHQDENARYLERHNGAFVLKEKESSPGQRTIPGLRERLLALIENERLLRDMGENNHALANGSGAENIVDVLFRIARPEKVAYPEIRRRVAVPA